MKIWYDKNSRYGKPIPRETAWRVLVGILVLAVVLLVIRNFGIIF